MNHGRQGKNGATTPKIKNNISFVMESDGLHLTLWVKIKIKG
jgi:hypothetical protein